MTPARTACSLLAFAAAVALPLWMPRAGAQEAAAAGDDKVRLGAGEFLFEWDESWGRLPEGMGLGNTHGCTVVDSAGRVYVNTDSEHAVVVFDADGDYRSSWGADLRGGLHGMTLVEEDGEEFLYLAHTGRREVLKTTLEGEVLWRLGWPEESGLYEKAEDYRPTAVAVGPDGRLFVADGYGLSWIHVYDAERNYLRSFGGRGQGRGQLQTPHGLWLDTRGDEPVLIVADRENHRLQLFDLEGRPLGLVHEGLRRPCNVHEHEGKLVVADLAGRITLLDEKNELIAHLGDNPDPEKRAKNGIPRAAWKPGEFLSPHSAAWGAGGDLYVMDWLALGRVTRLRRIR